MQRTRKIYYDKKVDPIQDYNSVELRGIAPLLVILVFGVVFSSLLLIIERVHYTKTKMHM
jgi:hypothetical protein